MKDYPLKITDKQLKILKYYWKELERVQNKFNEAVRFLEAQMETETEIEGIEYFMVDNDYVGIGNADRTMKLIHRPLLEK